MNDFVTRLESELNRAAIRQERAAGRHGVALPRLRALPGLAATAAAAAGAALALVAVAAVFLGSEPERAAGGGVPAELRGTWRLPTTGERGEDRAPADLRLYSRGSERCAGLGVGAKPCYAIDNFGGGALEWGTFSVAGDRITLRAQVHVYCRPKPCEGVGTPGVYRWRVRDGSLHLAKLRDELSARPGALASAPLTRASEPAKTKIPDGWTANRFTSKRYGYSIRYPGDWSALDAARSMPPDGLATDTSDAVDKLSPDPRRGAVPMVLIAAYEVPEGTTFGRWTPQISSRDGCTGQARGGGSATVDGEPALVMVASECNGTDQQSATFVHGGRGYQVAWWGEPRRWEADAPLFEATLKTFRFND
jgi:hypothetical protein